MRWPKIYWLFCNAATIGNYEMKDFRQDQQYVDMKAQFDEYYEQKLKRIFYDQEKVRHRYFSSFVVLILLALCFYPAVLYYVFTHFQLAAGEHDYTGYVLSSSGVLIMILCGPMFLYKSRVKPEIMPKFAEHSAMITAAPSVIESSICLSFSAHITAM